jgi:hypothetical protein
MILNMQGFVCRHVSDKELARIEDGKNYGMSHGQKVPYSLIFKDIKVWGMWLATLGGATGFNTFVQFGPIYLNKVSLCWHRAAKCL